MQVYGTKSVCEFLLANQPWKQYLQGGNFTLMSPLIPGTPLQLSKSLTVTTAAVPHRAEFSDAVGFYIQVGRCAPKPCLDASKPQQSGAASLSTGRCAAGADTPAQSSRATSRCCSHLLINHVQGPSKTAFYLPDIDSWDKWAAEGTDIRQVCVDMRAAEGGACCLSSSPGCSVAL